METQDKITGTTITEMIVNDLNEHKLKNIIKGWVTSIFLGLPLIVIAIILPFKHGEIDITYNPEWYMRMFLILLGGLALLAPNKVPTVILELIDLLKQFLSKKSSEE